jgi:hypothetical protein
METITFSIEQVHIDQAIAAVGEHLGRGLIWTGSTSPMQIARAAAGIPYCSFTDETFGNFCIAIFGFRNEYAFPRADYQDELMFMTIAHLASHGTTSIELLKTYQPKTIVLTKEPLQMASGAEIGYPEPDLTHDL